MKACLHQPRKFVCSAERENVLLFGDCTISPLPPFVHGRGYNQALEIVLMHFASAFFLFSCIRALGVSSRVEMKNYTHAMQQYISFLNSYDGVGK